MSIIEKIKELKKKMQEMYSLLDEVEGIIDKFLKERGMEITYQYESEIFTIFEDRKQDILNMFKSNPLIELPVSGDYDYVYILEDGRVVGAKDKFIRKEGKIVIESKYGHIGWVEGDRSG